MTSGISRLLKLAILVCIDAALVVFALAGIAQAAPGGPDFPKVPSTSADDAPADEPPPPMPHSRDAKQSQSSTAANRNARPTVNSHNSQNNNGGNANNYSGNGNYNNGGNGPSSNAVNRNAHATAYPSVAEQAQWAADQRAAQIQYQTNTMADNYHSVQPYGYQATPSQASYQATQYGNPSGQQPKSGISSLFSSLGWQSNSNQRANSGRMNLAEAPREPVVGPDAVYIDAEQIPAGRASMQSSPVRFAPGQSSSGAMQGGQMSNGQMMGSQTGGMPMRAGQMPSVQANPGQSSRRGSSQGQIVSEESMPDGQPGGRIVEGPNGQMPMDDGEMDEGDGPMMDGTGPTMRGGPHQFLNPYCNDCRCGQGCGGSCQTCNRGGNWITDDDDGDVGDGGDCGCQTCHRTGCSCDECPNCAGHRPGHYSYGRPWVLFPFDWLDTHLSDGDSGWWWGRDFTVFAGVHNFRNPVDLGVNSNFGFQEGVNFSFPVLTGCFNIAAQVGYEATQSDLDPSAVVSDRRTQSFLTAGVFHRNDRCVGWEFGATFDWLHDNYYQDFDLGQVRSEIGCWCNRCNEIGFTSSIGLWTDNTADQFSPLGALSYSVIDQYFFFYRHKFQFGGDLRLGGGFTGRNGDNDKNCGLVGADFSVPLSCCLAVEGGFNYMIPGASTTETISSETWNVGINLVWYPGGTAKCGCSPFRPLLGVADNGSMLVTRRGTLPQ